MSRLRIQKHSSYMKNCDSQNHQRCKLIKKPKLLYNNSPTSDPPQPYSDSPTNQRPPPPPETNPQEGNLQTNIRQSEPEPSQTQKVKTRWRIATKPNPKPYPLNPNLVEE